MPKTLLNVCYSQSIIPYVYKDREKLILVSFCTHCCLMNILKAFFHLFFNDGMGVLSWVEEHDLCVEERQGQI